MDKNSPAFQYYPADMATDPEVMFWDMEAIGCYHTLIDYLWLNGGKCEFNLELICKLFRVNRKKTAEKLWEKIEKKFVLENGVITHKRILKEMQRQADNRVKKSEAGKKGMKKRWGSDNNSYDTDTKEDITKDNPSTSTSSSTSNKRSNKEKEIFNEARILYQGTKRGNDTEFENFKKHRDWKEVLPLLLPMIENQIENRKALLSSGAFVPEWKNFKTWINQRCWEEELGKPQTTKDGSLGLKLCVVCRSSARKYQNDLESKPVYLCQECLDAIKSVGVNAFGQLPIAKIEELVLKGKAKRD